jgi:hypothetical protein
LELDAELLPDEDPIEARTEDAEHWIRVYGELLATVNGVLANHELASGDRTVLEEYRPGP